MKLMIRCDMEGVTGVVHPTQASAESPDFSYGLEMLHHDINAVVDGLLTTGDHEIWIYDMHFSGRSLHMARLDPHVRVVCGKPHYRPGNVGGLTSDFDGLILVGFHSKAGTGQLLAHSYERHIQDIRLNNISVGEIGIEAALAGEMAVPPILVTGDSAGCAEAHALVEDVVTVAVKDSLGPTTAVCYPTADTGARPRAGARLAAERADEFEPFRVKHPATLSIGLENGPFADHVRGKMGPHTQKDGSIRVQADSLALAWQKFLEAKP